MKRIRIVVADDHTLIRRGIVGLLDDQPDMEVVGQADDGAEALQKVRELKPDVVLLDIGMPGASGIETARQITAGIPQTRVLILTMHKREAYLREALRAGAAGYIVKGSDVQDLLAAVRTVSSGGVYVDPSLTTALVTDYVRQTEAGAARGSSATLTPREREVLRLVAQGNTTREVAEILHISPHTIRTHRDNVMEKLELHSTAELTSYAIREGLLELD